MIYLTHEQLAYWRKLRGYSQAQLARACNCDVKVISRYESGFNRMRNDIMERVVDNLDLPPVTDHADMLKVVELVDRNIGELFRQVWKSRSYGEKINNFLGLITECQRLDKLRDTLSEMETANEG